MNKKEVNIFFLANWNYNQKEVWCCGRPKLGLTSTYNGGTQQIHTKHTQPAAPSSQREV